MSKPAISTPKEANVSLPFVVVETGAKQYIVSEGAELRVEKLNVDAGGEVVFDKVLLSADASGKVTVGTPYITGKTVTVSVVAQGKGNKIRVVRFKAKSNRHRTYGHRQPFTKVAVKSVK